MNRPVPAQQEMPFAFVHGTAVTEVPRDLYIPPDALEVFIEAFEGPLDLLLYLIRRQNLDILNIPIAEITRQYVEYVEVMRELRLELAGEYLVMAATLAEIKSRLLLPRPAAEEEEEADPRADLVRRLQEYERYRRAAEALDEIAREGRDFFVAGVDASAIEPWRPPPRVSLEDLVAAFADLMSRAAMFAAHHIAREPLSVRERMASVLARTRSRRDRTRRVHLAVHPGGGARRGGGDPPRNPGAVARAADRSRADRTVLPDPRPDPGRRPIMSERFEDQLRPVVEVVLLAAEGPVSLDELVALAGTESDMSVQELRDALRRVIGELAAECEGRGLELREVASGFRFQVREEYARWVARFLGERPARYSRALLETLALIAYRQPITRGEIEDVRGVGVSTSIMRTLHEREWIRVLAHREVPGRPALYGVTRKFLDDFGLKGVEDLPPLDEIGDVQPADLFPAGPLGAGNGSGAPVLGLTAPGRPGEGAPGPGETGEDGVDGGEG